MFFQVVSFNTHTHTSNREKHYINQEVFIILSASPQGDILQESIKAKELHHISSSYRFG